jgi:hypothetical protein
MGGCKFSNTPRFGLLGFRLKKLEPLQQGKGISLVTEALVYVTEKLDVWLRALVSARNET